jgi:Glucose / Sorbosone dehydrogenase
MRCNPADGSDLELMACGLRNAYGIGFLPDGRLIAIDHGADDRGSRSVGNASDLLYEIRKGAWYGWPDFISGEPITDPKYLPKRGPEPTFVLANHDELPVPETPLLRFSPNTATGKFDAAYSSKTLLPDTVVIIVLMMMQQELGNRYYYLWHSLDMNVP